RHRPVPSCPTRHTSLLLSLWYLQPYRFLSDLIIPRVQLFAGFAPFVVSSLKNGDGGRILARMRYGDMCTRCAERVESLKRRPAQFQSRRAGLRRLDFDVRPSDISRPTRSESLESGLFGCEATCVMNRARIARFAISLLVRSKNSVDESRPVP